MNEQHSTCEEVQRSIWTEGPHDAPADHIESCDDCGEQSRRAGDLQAALLGLRSRDAHVPLELEASILEAVSRTRTSSPLTSSVDRARDVVSHPKFWKGAAVGAAAAATAVAGLLVARRLTRSEQEADVPSLVA